VNNSVTLEFGGGSSLSVLNLGKEGQEGQKRKQRKWGGKEEKGEEIGK